MEDDQGLLCSVAQLVRVKNTEKRVRPQFSNAR